MKKKRMKKIIIICLFVLSVDVFSSNFFIVNSDNVNLRENSSINSKIIKVLNKNFKVEVVEKNSENVLIGKYFGSWYKVKYNNIEGYILSSFLDDGNSEKFHVFYDDFYKKIIERDNKALLKIQYPLEFVVLTSNDSNEDVEAKYMVNNDKLQIRDLLNGNGKLSDPQFLLQKDLIVVYFEYVGTSTAFWWYFKNISNKWYLVKVKTTDF